MLRRHKLELGGSSRLSKEVKCRQVKVARHGALHVRRVHNQYAEVYICRWKQGTYHSKYCLSSACWVEGGKALPTACALDARAVGLVAQGAAQLEARLRCRMQLTAIARMHSPALA